MSPAQLAAREYLHQRAADVVRTSRLATLNKLRCGWVFPNGYGQRLVNDRAAGKFLNDPEMDGAISQWLWLTADNDRKAAERAEAAPIVDQYTHLHAGLINLRDLIVYGRPAHLIRAQFEAWVIDTAARRKALEGSRRRSIAALQGAFNRRLRQYERAGACP